MSSVPENKLRTTNTGKDPGPAIQLRQLWAAFFSRVLQHAREWCTECGTDLIASVRGERDLEFGPLCSEERDLHIVHN